jgi:hypothetical protein
MGHLCSLYLLRVKTEGRCSLSDIPVWLQPEANIWFMNSVDTIHIWKQHYRTVGTTVAQWLRFRATNRKVVGSIPDGVIGFFR